MLNFNELVNILAEKLKDDYLNNNDIVGISDESVKIISLIYGMDEFLIEHFIIKKFKEEIK